MSMQSPQLILASGSPRRKELLNLLGLSFTIQTSNVDETVDPALTPAQVVEQLALEKARAVAENHEHALVIGSDTIVVLDGEILGKPRDAQEARHMLHRLQGRPHQVLTGITLVHVGAGETRTLTNHRTTQVWMRPLSTEKIDWYVQTGEPLDKAGAYGIQGYGATLVDKIDGCYFNVVGMSLVLLDEMVEQMGFSFLTDFNSKEQASAIYD